MAKTGGAQRRRTNCRDDDGGLGLPLLVAIDAGGDVCVVNRPHELICKVKVIHKPAVPDRRVQDVHALNVRHD